MCRQAAVLILMLAGVIAWSLGSSCSCDLPQVASVDRAASCCGSTVDHGQVAPHCGDRSSDGCDCGHGHGLQALPPQQIEMPSMAAAEGDEHSPVGVAAILDWRRVVPAHLIGPAPPPELEGNFLQTGQHRWLELQRLLI